MVDSQMSSVLFFWLSSINQELNLEPTTGIEPVNLILTKDVLYLLSYVGQIVYFCSNFTPEQRRPAPLIKRLISGSIRRGAIRMTRHHHFLLRAFDQMRMERETGFEPATLSLEG